ncbi:hypothetical protein MPSEU_000180700 [Mayamaea pseudoterrestris]|nr:hypothetical protein MPSEU_000180700 [Mayamaea pseudoterrestris]
MLRRPSIPSLLRAPSLVDQSPSYARRPSLAGEKTFKVPDHPDDIKKESSPRRGSGLLGNGLNESFMNLLAPRATIYDPEVSMTFDSDDNPEALFSTEEMTTSAPKVTKPVSRRAAKPISAEQAARSSGYALSEDKWSNMTNQGDANKAKLRGKLMFWKKHHNSAGKNATNETPATLPESAVGIGSNAAGETTPESAAPTAESAKTPAIRRLIKSIRRSWSKLEDWLAYQRFLLGRGGGGGRDGGTGDYDGLESVYSVFTSPTAARAE